MKTKKRKSIYERYGIGIYLTKEGEESIDIVIEHDLSTIPIDNWQHTLVKDTEAMIHIRLRKKHKAKARRQELKINQLMKKMGYNT